MPLRYLTILFLVRLVPEVLVTVSAETLARWSELTINARFSAGYSVMATALGTGLVAAALVL